MDDLLFILFYLPHYIYFDLLSSGPTRRYPLMYSQLRSCLPESAHHTATPKRPFLHLPPQTFQTFFPLALRLPSLFPSLTSLQLIHLCLFLGFLPFQLLKLLYLLEFDFHLLNHFLFRFLVNQEMFQFFLLLLYLQFALVHHHLTLVLTPIHNSQWVLSTLRPPHCLGQTYLQRLLYLLSLHQDLPYIFVNFLHVLIVLKLVHLLTEGLVIHLLLGILRYVCLS